MVLQIDDGVFPCLLDAGMVYPMVMGGGGAGDGMLASPERWSPTVEMVFPLPQHTLRIGLEIRGLD
jgi:hypothetical protein